MSIFRKNNRELPTVPLSTLETTTEEGKTLEYQISGPPEEEPHYTHYLTPEVGFFQLLKVFPKVKVSPLFSVYKRLVTNLLDEDGQGLIVKINEWLSSISKYFEFIMGIAEDREEYTSKTEWGYVPFFPMERANVEALRTTVTEKAKEIADEFELLCEKYKGAPEKINELSFLVDEFLSLPEQDETVNKVFSTSFDLGILKGGEPGTDVVRVDPLKKDLVGAFVGIKVKLANAKSELGEKFEEHVETLQEKKEEIEKLYAKYGPKKFRSLTPEEFLEYIKRLQKKWNVKSSLRKLSSFVREKYTDYNFWKYTDRYVDRLAKLDDDPFIFGIQFGELFRKDSSLDDIIYRNLFIKLFSEFLQEELDK
jgi:hypothetical protein